MKWTRRDFIRASAGTGAALLAGVRPASSRTRKLILKPIPSTGEEVPVVGVGTREYRAGAGADQLVPFVDTLEVFLEAGGRVIDTAPSYGNSEEVLGRVLARLEARTRVFLATKVDQEGRDAGIERMERSLGLLGGDTVDLVQVHNLRDVDTQLATLSEWKAAGRVRYVGITTSSSRQYEDFEAVMKRYELDFVQVDYSLANRGAAERLLPLAADRGMASLINLPFGRGRLFARVGDRPVPEWAAEAGIASWGQFFLKYVVSHPAVTVAIPGTTKPHHARDNMGAAMGELPDASMRRRMEEFYDALPEPG